MATDDTKAVEKPQSGLPPSPVGTESEKPAQDQVENVASDEESQRHQFQASTCSQIRPATSLCWTPPYLAIRHANVLFWW